LLYVALAAWSVTMIGLVRQLTARGLANKIR
jgi:hypothetical protein